MTHMDCAACSSPYVLRNPAATSLNDAKAASRCSMISCCNTSGGGRSSRFSRLLSLSQKMSNEYGRCRVRAVYGNHPMRPMRLSPIRHTQIDIASEKSSLLILKVRCVYQGGFTVPAGLRTIEQVSDGKHRRSACAAPLCLLLLLMGVLVYSCSRGSSALHRAGSPCGLAPCGGAPSAQWVQPGPG